MPSAIFNRVRVRTAFIASFISLITLGAQAQTWAGGRETPSLDELVSVDATGEPLWPYGAEDIAGDGVARFEAAERSVDLRSVYAATDDVRFYLRSYVSAETAPDTSLRLYVFIDTDDDPASGGSAAADEIDPAFTGDPTSGGYEHVLGVSGAGDILGVWSFNAGTDAFVEQQNIAAQTSGEAGVDLDPLRFGEDQRGYLQAAVTRTTVDVDLSCGLALFVRALSDAGNDLDASTRVPCTPPDANSDGVPDVIERVDECTTNADCPADGVCIDGSCRYTAACVDDADCPAGESCDARGLCVADGGADCDSSADCDGLVCVSGTCTPCTTSGASCGDGQTCGPDGRCVSGTPGGDGSGAGGAAALVDADEEVQGGAFSCGLARRHGAFPWLAFFGLLLLALRRKRA